MYIYNKLFCCVFVTDLMLLRIVLNSTFYLKNPLILKTACVLNNYIPLYFPLNYSQFFFPIILSLDGKFLKIKDHVFYLH